MAGIPPFFVFGGTGEALSFPVQEGYPVCITRAEFDECCCRFDPSDFFQGYTNPASYFRRFAVFDWDSCLFAGSPVYESDEPYPVDGHYTWEAIGGGQARVVEATGNLVYLLGTESAIAAIDRLDGVIVSNLRRNSSIYNGYCSNLDGSRIFGEVSVRVPGSPRI